MRLCTKAECPTLVEQHGFCSVHRPAAELARGSRQQRGYGADHERLRRKWAPRVATGRVRCARCHQRIAADAAWDLGHVDSDRTKYQGPEHQRCNRGAAGRFAHR